MAVIAGPTGKTVSRYYIVYFLLVWGIAWSIVTVLLDPTVPYDAVEALNWAQNAEWGSPKNPWLPGVVMMPVTGESWISRSVWWYVSHFGAAATGMAGVWFLASAMNPDRRLAQVAFFSLNLSGAVNIDIIPYNDNYLLVMLWPWMLYFYYQALTRSLLWWLAFAVAAGLACMAKYSSFAFVAGVFLSIVAVRQYRRYFRQPVFLLSVCLFLLMITPNILWLGEHGFAAFHWVGSQITTGFNARLPLVVVSVFYPLLLLAFGLYWCGARLVAPGDSARRAVLFVCIVPLVVILSWFLFHHGGRLTEWLQPFLIPAPALLVSCVRLPEGQTERRLVNVCLAVGGLVLAGYVSVMVMNVRNAGEKFSGIKGFSAEVERMWQSRYPVPLRYVGGGWLSEWLMFYLPSGPETLSRWSVENMPNIYNRDISEAQLRHHGGVVIGEAGETCIRAQFRNFYQDWPGLSLDERTTLYFGADPLSQPVPVCVAFISPGRSS